MLYSDILIIVIFVLNDYVYLQIKSDKKQMKTWNFR